MSLERPALILNAKADTWKKLEAMMAANEPDDGDWNNLLSQLRYKLWRTGNRDKPA